MQVKDSQNARDAAKNSKRAIAGTMDASKTEFFQVTLVKLTKEASRQLRVGKARIPASPNP